jgi:phosphotransacetylase
MSNESGETLMEGQVKILAPTQHIERQKKGALGLGTKRALFDFLMALNKNYAPLKTAVIQPHDDVSLEGALRSALDGTIAPILIGNRQKIQDVAQKIGYEIHPYTILEASSDQEAAALGVHLVKEGQAEALMKGKIHTDDLMRAVVDKTRGIRGSRRMSHVFVVDHTKYPKPLLLTDAALNISPSLTDKIDIVKNAIDLFQALDLGIPKVAIVSAVETVTDKIPSTIDATVLSKMSERGQIPGGIIDGPLAFDNAVSMESVQLKGIESKVAGQADIIVVPNIEAGNILYKEMTYFSGMETAGLVLGARAPIILTSRGSDLASRQASCAMALIYVRHHEGGRA